MRIRLSAHPNHPCVQSKGNQSVHATAALRVLHSGAQLLCAQELDGERARILAAGGFIQDGRVSLPSGI